MTVSADRLMAECLKEKYKRQLSRPEVFPSEENWDYIIAHRMTDVGAGLYRKFLVSATLPTNERCDYHALAIAKFPEYLKAVDRRYALDVVYSDVTSLPSATLKLIIDCQLFDSRKLMRLLQERDEYVFVIRCLAAYQPSYSERDLDEMTRLKNALDNPTPLGKIVTNRTIFKQETRYICPNGHTNDSSCEYCEAEGCGLNINGLTRSDAFLIDEFDNRIHILSTLLNQGI